MPQFSAGAVKTAKITLTNPKAKATDYNAWLYMGADFVPMVGVSFSLGAGQSKGVSFSVTMPSVAGTYPVYIGVFSGGVTIALYKAVEDVVIVALPEWVVAVSDNSPSDWLLIGPSPSGARDGDFNSYAAVRVPPLSWSSFLELTFASEILATKCRYKALYHYDGINVIDIDAYYNGAWQHVYQGPFADRITEVKSLGGTYSVTKIRARFYNSYAGEDGSWLYELQLGRGALVAQPDFFMPAVMVVVVTDGSILNMYWNCKFSVTITNKESVVGTHIINWWDNAGVIAGSQQITLNPGETYIWQWNQLADFRRIAAPYTMQLSGDWVTNNLSKGDAYPA